MLWHSNSYRLNLTKHSQGYSHTFHIQAYQVEDIQDNVCGFVDSGILTLKEAEAVNEALRVYDCLPMKSKQEELPIGIRGLYGNVERNPRKFADVEEMMTLRGVKI